MDEPFQTVDNLMKTQFVCNLETRSLSFVDVDCNVRHSLSAGGPPSASLLLWGLPWTRFSRRSLVPSVPINFALKSLSTDCLPSPLGSSACGVSASQ